MIYLDEDPRNADWIKTLRWDLPTEPDRFLRAIGGEDRLAEFLHRPAAEAMPPALRQELASRGMVVKYSPEEPRDDHGRWASGPESSMGIRWNDMIAQSDSAQAGLPMSTWDRAAAVWYGGGYGDLRQALADPSKATPRARAFAEEMARVVATEPYAAPGPLYRGINIPADEAARYAAMRPGEKVTMNLSSWSENLKTATEFTRMPEMHDTRLIFEASGVRGVGIGGDQGEQEWLTDGRFTVQSTGVDPDGTVRMSLSHDGTLPATDLVATKVALI